MVQHASKNQVHTVCHPAPVDKRKYISDIGRILVKDYGKKKYYKPKEVKEAHLKSDWYVVDLDFSCWAMSTYSSHEDFDSYHQETGEVCDYTEMKSTMLEGISTSDIGYLSELSGVDLDGSWLDFGMLEDVLGGIGEFFAGIAESVDL